jgi:hypothetical protein
MKNIFRLIGTKASELSVHPLFTEWFANDTIPARQKFVFTPMAVDFIMGFRDFNRYFVRYPNPTNELEAAINAHAAEDETHSLLLLKDWATLDLDATLRWRPRDLFWWMTSEWTEEARRMDFELISMIWHNADPLVRFAIIESMEAAGNVFFKRTVRVVKSIGTDQDRLFSDFPYYGPDHFARETGHLQGGADERPFLRATLTPESRAAAEVLVARVFEIFRRHFDSWYALACSMRAGTWRFDATKEGREAAKLRPDTPHDVTAAMKLEHPATPAPEVAALVKKRQAAFDELWETPAYRWMRETWPGDFRRMVRFFLLQWVVDNWACADYFAFDTTYADPKTPLERGINRLSKLYASEMRCRYTEWETLQLDEYTRWTALEALRHYWLDERVEEHRRVFADLRKLTFEHPEPLYRYWILKCFVRFGDSMIRSLGVALERSQEKEDDFAMFAGAPERMHPDLPPDPEADEAVFALERQPLTPEQVRTIDRIIEETKRQESERSAITWRIIEERRYETFDRHWAERNHAATVRKNASASRPDGTLNDASGV